MPIPVDKTFPRFSSSCTINCNTSSNPKLKLLDTYTFRGPQAGVAVKETFNFRGKRAYFVEDIGFMLGGTRGHLAEPIEMANALFEFIAELAMSKIHRLIHCLMFSVITCEAAFFWKRLLKTAVPSFPKVFAPHLFELCIAKPIQMSREVFSRTLYLFTKPLCLSLRPSNGFRLKIPSWDFLKKMTKSP